MEKKDLEERVNKIVAEGGDDEAAHSDEDRLHIDLINEFCPDWVKEEVRRLSDADFNRWCA